MYIFVEIVKLSYEKLHSLTV